MQFPLTERMHRFPVSWRKSSHLLKGFYVRQRPQVFNASGEDHEGRVRAKILRRDLREKLGRKPTAKEYRAAKKAAKAGAGQ